MILKTRRMLGELHRLYIQNSHRHWNLADWREYISFLGSHSKVTQMRWFKQQKSVVSQFWKPEVQIQGASWSMFCLRARVGILLSLLELPCLPATPWLSLVWRGIASVTWLTFPVSLHSIFPPYLSLCVQISPFYKDTSHIGLRLTLVFHFNLIIVVETLFSNKVPLWGADG